MVSVNADYIPLRDVPALLPRKGGKKISVSALYRWTGTHGLRGVRLRTAQIGGARYTRQEWLSEFFSELSVKAGLVDQSTPSETNQNREAEIARSEARVKSLVG